MDWGGVGWPAEEFNVCLQPVYSSSQWPMLQSRAPNLAIHVLTPASSVKSGPCWAPRVGTEQRQTQIKCSGFA